MNENCPRNSNSTYLASTSQLIIPCIILCLYTLDNVIAIVIFAAFYRLSVLLNLTKFTPIFENIRYVIIWVVAYQAIFVGSLYYSIGRHQSADRFLLDNGTISKNAPFLEPLMNEHKIYGKINH